MINVNRIGYPLSVTSIRPGWFYHEKEDSQVRTAENLMDLYFSSVGRGASLLLNLPIDRRGRIHENDIKSLLEFRRVFDQTFGKDLAKGARALGTNSQPYHSAGNVVDGVRQTYWLSNEQTNVTEVVLSFSKPVTFNIVRLREYLPLGQRVEAFEVDQWSDGSWKLLAQGTSIGNCRLIRSNPLTTDRVRLRITQTAAPPAISEVGLFNEQNVRQAVSLSHPNHKDQNR